MNRLAIVTPVKAPQMPVSNCIGHFYIVYVASLQRRVLANCIDATPEDRPKRMRIQQSMDHGGEVIMPHQYTVIEKDPMWQD